MALAFATVACSHVETRRGHIDITSDPPGAYVTRSDDDGKIVVGQTPLSTDYRYDVHVKEYSFAAGWTASVLGWAIAAVGGYTLVNGISAASADQCGNCVGKMVLGSVGLGLGIALGATMTAVTLKKYSEVGEFPITASPVRFSASAGGRMSEELVLDISKPPAPIVFRLRPAVDQSGPPRPIVAPLPLPLPAPLPPVEVFPGSATNGTDSWAVVVGVEKYRESLPPATHAESDARAFAALAEKTLGVPATHIKLLVGERAGRQDVMSALGEWLPRNARTPGGTVYFFFSGHGAPEPESGDAYLVPYDADPAYLRSRALAVRDVHALLGQLQDQHVLMFVDACFSGGGVRSVIAQGTRPLVPVRIDLAPSNITAISAAGANETTGAAIASPHGLFTFHLIEAIKGAADSDGDHAVTVAEIARYVTVRVTKDAHIQNREQSPSVQLPPGMDANAAPIVTGLK